MRGHSLLIFFFLFLLACASCSVKEDRDECPCTLSLYTSEAQGKCVSVDVWNSEGVRVAAGETDGILLELEVPRGLLKVTAYSGLKSCNLFGEVVSIPGGMQMDELYSWRGDADCKGEHESLILFLHKQWATVNMRIQNLPAGDYFSAVRIEGDVSGYNLSSGLPVGGTFSFMPSLSPDGNVVFRLPRQGEGELLLGIGQKELLIGDIIARSGYDWGDDDLDDIYILVDYLKSTVKISISDWSEVSYEENF